MAAVLVTPDGATLCLRSIEISGSETIVCTGANQDGHPAEVSVSVASAILKLEAVPASEERARQERIGFRAVVAHREGSSLSSEGQ